MKVKESFVCRLQEDLQKCRIGNYENKCKLGNIFTCIVISENVTERV